MIDDKPHLIEKEVFDLRKYEQVRKK